MTRHSRCQHQLRRARLCASLSCPADTPARGVGACGGSWGGSTAGLAVRASCWGGRGEAVGRKQRADWHGGGGQRGRESGTRRGGPQLAEYGRRMTGDSSDGSAAAAQGRQRARAWSAGLQRPAAARGRPAQAKHGWQRRAARRLGPRGDDGFAGVGWPNRFSRRPVRAAAPPAQSPTGPLHPLAPQADGCRRAP